MRISKTKTSRALATAILFISSTMLASACTNRCADVEDLETDNATGPTILAVGDSILAWSADRCMSIPDHVALALETPVESRAVNGTRVLGGDDDKPAIPRQYDDASARREPFDIVIVNGGGNDLNGTCECGACDDVLDALIAADATSGAMVSLIGQMRSDGARVVLVDYFVLHEDAWYGFDRCESALAELDRRYALLAELQPAITLVDLGDVVTPTEHPEAYAFDHVHPSDEGAALLGTIIAQAMQ